MTSQAVMKRYLTSVAKNNEEYKDNKSMQTLASLIANYKNLDAEDKEVLDAKIESAYNKLQAKGVSATKSSSKATTTRRTKSSTDGGLKAILAELKKKLGAEKFKDATTGTDIKKDIQIPALKKGKRIVRKKGYTTNQYGKFKNKIGTAYWESRANRYDANQPSQTRKYKLADGGNVDNKIRFDVDFYDDSQTRSDTSVELILRASSLDNVIKDAIKKAYELKKNYIEFYHKNLFLGSVNFAISSDFREGRGYKSFANKYAKGGEIEVGSIVNLPEIKMKDGRVQYERVVGGEVIGIEDGIYDVLNPKTNRLHRVTKQQIEQIDQAKAKHTRSRGSLRSNEDTYPKGTEFAKGGKFRKVKYPIAYIDVLQSKPSQFTKVRKTLEKYGIEIDNSKNFHTKGYAEELYGENYNGEEIYTIVCDIRDASNPIELEKEIDNLFNKYSGVSVVYHENDEYAKGGNIERGSAHMYITMTNGDYKIYHGDDVRLKANAKPLHTFKNAKEGTYMKIWKLLSDKKFARGGNVSQMTQAEKEQAEKEIHDAWEGKNIDDYVMYSDRYKKGGKMAKGGEVKEKSPKFKVGDKVYSYQNKSESAPIAYARFSAWDKENGAHENDVWKYKLSLKDGYSNWINEESLSKTKMKTFAQGGTTKRIKRKGC